MSKSNPSNPPSRLTPAATPGRAAAQFQIEPPRDYVLARDVCSYGYFLLEPNLWDPGTRSLRRVLEVEGEAIACVIDQDGAGGRSRRGSVLTVRADRAMSGMEVEHARTQIERMLRLNEDAATIRAFHRVDPRWKKSGRGRLFRSPTFFEDVIKTITSCNVTWPGTVGMNRKLCAVYGAKSASGLRAFPSAAVLAKARANSLRARCGVGYRDARIVEAARRFVRNVGHIAMTEAEGLLGDETVRERLLNLPGVGPYAASNILQLIGRYAHLPLDTESVRHGRTVLGFKGTSRAVMKRVERHFAPFGEHRFRAYWFEMWAFYEAKRGPAHTWERERVGSSFTASQL